MTNSGAGDSSGEICNVFRVSWCDQILQRCPMRPHLRVNTEASVGDPDRFGFQADSRMYGAKPAIDARTFLTDCL